VSTKGKLHIILNISPDLPILEYDKSGKHGKLLPTGGVTFEHSPKAKLMLLLYFKKVIRDIMGNLTYDEQWDKAFDTGALGMHSPYTVKIQGGKCHSRRIYEPIDKVGQVLTDKEKCDIIMDCSIYKPVTGQLIDIKSINHDNGSISHVFFEKINKFVGEYDKKLQAKKVKLAKKYSAYKYDATNKSVTVYSMKYNITQQFIDERIERLPQSFLNGGKWNSAMRNIANISIIIPKFNPEFLVHKWSSNGTEYNSIRNSEIWKRYCKYANEESVSTSICWLLANSGI
jgi:hypothetical protein